jgi:hypothetical protein
MLFLATIAWYSCDVTVSILYILIVYPFYDCTVVFQILGECGYISKIHCFLHLFKRIFYFKRKGNIFTVLYIFSCLLNYPDQYTTPIRWASYRLLWIIRIGAEVVIFSFSLSRDGGKGGRAGGEAPPNDSLVPRKRLARSIIFGPCKLLRPPCPVSRSSSSAKIKPI